MKTIVVGILFWIFGVTYSFALTVTPTQSVVWSFDVGAAPAFDPATASSFLLQYSYASTDPLNLGEVARVSVLDSSNTPFFSNLNNGPLSGKVDLIGFTSGFTSTFSVLFESLAGTFDIEPFLGLAQWQFRLVDDNKRVIELKIENASIATVPLPAGIPLLGGGLAILGFLGCRKKKRTSATAAA